MKTSLKPVLIAAVSTFTIIYVTIFRDSHMVLALYPCVFAYIILIPLLLKSEPNKDVVFKITGLSIIYTLLMYYVLAGVSRHLLSDRTNANLFESYAESAPELIANTIIYLIPVFPVSFVIAAISMLVLKKFSK